MKRILSLLLVVAMIFSMTACSKEKNNSDINTNNTKPSVSDTTTPTEPTQPSEEDKFISEEDEYKRGFLELKDVDFEQFDAFQIADISAEELNNKLMPIFDDGMNCAMYTEASVSVKYKLNGDITSSNIYTTSYLANKDDNIYGFTFVDLRTTPNSSNNLLGTTYYYCNTDNGDGYVKTDMEENGEWEYSDSYAYFAISTFHCQPSISGIDNNTKIYDDGNGHYVIRIETAEEFSGMLSSLGKVSADSVIYYVIEKDISAIRMYMNEAKFDKSKFAYGATDIESNFDAFFAIYNIGKIKDDEVIPSDEILALKPVDTDQENSNQFPVGSPEVFVHDYANLLTENEELMLIEEFTKLCEGMQVNVLFLTTDDADGQTTKMWSDNYMDELFPLYDHNIAIIIDMDNREYYINTMGLFIDFLDDDKIETALDLGYEYIVSQAYCDGLLVMGDYCIKQIKK